ALRIFGGDESIGRVAHPPRVAHVGDRRPPHRFVRAPAIGGEECLEARAAGRERSRLDTRCAVVRITWTAAEEELVLVPHAIAVGIFGGDGAQAARNVASFSGGAERRTDLPQAIAERV